LEDVVRDVRYRRELRAVFEVSPTDWPTYLGIAMALGGAALLACWIPAGRAARMDPVLALRGD